MWGKISNSKLLISFDKEAEDFIYAAGLNNDANLNVSGLYDAQRARFELALLVSKLKACGAYSNIVSFFPMMGGTNSMIVKNLNPLNPDLDLGASAYCASLSVPIKTFNSTSRGLNGIADTGLLADVNLSSNVTLVTYCQSNYNLTSTTGQYISSRSFGTGFTNSNPGILNYRNQSQVSPGKGNYNKIRTDANGSYIGALGFNVGTSQLNTTNIQLNTIVPNSAGGGTFTNDNNRIFLGMGGHLQEESISILQNCVGIFKPMLTNIQLAQVLKAIEEFNSGLGISAIK